MVFMGLSLGGLLLGASLGVASPGGPRGGHSRSSPPVVSMAGWYGRLAWLGLAWLRLGLLTLFNSLAYYWFIGVLTF